MKHTRFAALAFAALGGAVALAGCGSDPTPAAGSNGAEPSKSGSCPSGTLNAEGSSAQKNAIEQAIADYQTKCADVTINYNPTGSGAGIKQFNAGQVDFAGSDSALKTEPKDGVVEADAAKKRCANNPAWNLPMAVGPIAISYNLQGVGNLVLDGPTAAKIFNGTIKTWNDPAIAKLNKGVKLPSAKIVVFYRSDESGTTENFTKYLQASSGGAWKTEPAKSWEGTGSGKNKSAGVASGVKATPNSITYVEWSYARDNKLAMASIDTGSGAGPVKLTGESAGKAVAAAKPDGQGNDLRLKLDYATKAKGAYPIVLVTYEIVCSKGLDASKAGLVKGFLTDYSSEQTQTGLADLGYAPLPAQVRTKVEAAVKAIR
ncbi:phosphate transport system substrate-binding protein [Actinopolymorpha cephalotaxi]|uniref:Phosphate-binding protein n=1 Tax=Actinopolymorpha cephalotaxi TaxID=504797 RepID=A0A1I2XUW2_9ACTN|nr:phosphate ABC transporter substrate-binding protein PstS [Actinopolymorpha cephalotaxi]NYH87197.1 phosphate transport system substrate-binding protein [Actinopolymorpha cephalotaxi]SFH17175.1 phosphate transport system substrate-binding protein [Actinopolymorpha cephalotaxi]